jgi:uncharacterized Rmd1/YagE family protein
LRRAPFLEAVGAAQTISAHAFLLGERLNTHGLGHDGLISTAPLAFRVGDAGLVALFRYGAAVMIGVSPKAEREVLRLVVERVAGAEATPEEEKAAIVLKPDQDEQITSSGAIQLRDAAPDHLLIVADVLAKSVALARDEHQVATVFDAIEPFARSLASGGRSPPGGRRRMLRLIGEALLVQHRVSGRVAVREKPDILWDRPDLERLYMRLEDEYELVERAETLDRKLGVISDAATAFIDLQDAARSLRLEAIIVLLIVAELALAVLQWLGFNGR